MSVDNPEEGNTYLVIWLLSIQGLLYDPKSAVNHWLFYLWSEHRRKPKKVHVGDM